MKLILASDSPARKRALKTLGIPFEIRRSRIDERSIRHPDPAELVRLLAEAKAKHVRSSIPDVLVVAGDAVVSMEGRIYEKPEDLNQAQQFLHNFSGKTLQYVTAISIANSNNGSVSTAVQKSTISFRILLRDEISDYVGKYDVLACAGAFDANGVARFAEHISGSCNYLMGFSLAELVVMLRCHGVAV